MRRARCATADQRLTDACPPPRFPPRDTGNTIPGDSHASENIDGPHTHNAEIGARLERKGVRVRAQAAEVNTVEASDASRRSHRH